jgi:hypothetical protein
MELAATLTPGYPLSSLRGWGVTLPYWAPHPILVAKRRQAVDFVLAEMSDGQASSSKRDLPAKVSMSKR